MNYLAIAWDRINPLPIGLRFRDNPGDLTVRGTGNGARLTDSELIDTQEALRVDSNATIGLIGGNLLFEDATIKTAGGRIERKVSPHSATSRSRW